MTTAPVSADAFRSAAPSTGRQAVAHWIISPRADLILFVGVTLLTLLPWLVADVLHYPGWYALVGVAFVNGPHLISTWTRVYMPATERFRRPFHYWVVPGAVAAFAIVNELRGGTGAQLVRSVIFYWASWHFAAQSWGVLRIYQRKHGVVGSVEAKLERLLIFAPAFFCVLRRLYTGPWTLFGVEVLFLRPTATQVNAAGAVVSATAVAYLLRLAWGARRRPVHEYLRPVYLVFSFLGFAMPYMIIKDGTAAFAAAALWHAVQYMAIVWLYNRRRYAGGVDRSAHLVSWASQPGRWVAYLGLMAVCAAGVYGIALIVATAAHLPFEELGLIFWTALTLGHYYLDGVIWKSRANDLKVLR